jgi:hypothetical protein
MQPRRQIAAEMTAQSHEKARFKRQNAINGRSGSGTNVAFLYRNDAAGCREFDLHP